jgi:hypothetical protein
MNKVHFTFEQKEIERWLKRKKQKAGAGLVSGLPIVKAMVRIWVTERRSER